MIERIINQTFSDRLCANVTGALKAIKVLQPQTADGFVTVVGVEAFSILAFSVSVSALEFVVSKFTWRFSKSFSVHRQI